jgi:Fanconi anemia group M protein
MVEAAHEEQFDPQPGEYLPGLDLSEAKTLVLPKVPSVRDYQRAIIQTCVMKNTLVSLPTGLGKTLIAAVVMHNYLRWFPDKKVVFLAPSVSALLHLDQKT